MDILIDGQGIVRIAAGEARWLSFSLKIIHLSGITAWIEWMNLQNLGLDLVDRNHPLEYYLQERAYCVETW
jgi:hypothetical protein